MGRLLLVLGIIFVIVGLGSMVVGVTGVGSNFLTSITNAVTPTAEELCKPGERLEQEEGASEYTALEGYRHTVRYFCVNDANERREVTGDFVQGMLSQAFGSIPTMFIPAIGGCILTVGIFLAVIGLLISARQRDGSPRVLTQSYAFDFPQQSGTLPSRVRHHARPRAAICRQSCASLTKRASGAADRGRIPADAPEILDSMRWQYRRRFLRISDPGQSPSYPAL
ncbi:MAG: hypothetical protein U0703_17745 [Anaerolineae bacterium]